MTKWLLCSIEFTVIFVITLFISLVFLYLFITKYFSYYLRMFVFTLN